MRSRQSHLIRLLTMSAALGAATCGIRVAEAANILANPNLNFTGFTSQANPCPVEWNVVAAKATSGPYNDGGDSETFCDTDGGADNGGVGYGFFFKPFEGTAPSDTTSVQLYQDNPTTANTKFTLSGFAACEPNYSGLFATNTPLPATMFYVVFLDGSGNILASNVFNLIANGMPTNGAGAMAMLTTPQYTAPAGTATVRAGAAMFNTYSTSGQQSFFVDEFDLEATPPPGSPTITTQPSGNTVAPGGTVSLTVVATGATTYQWQHAGTNISNGGEYSGATTATLTITGASASDVGHYRVFVSNSSGAVYSSDAPLALLGLAINPVLTITGHSGDTYRVDYATSLAPTNWIPLSTNKLGTSALQIVDPTDARGGTDRFYRAVFLF